MGGAEEELYPFYNSNIHENRWAARIFRSVPLFSFIWVLCLVIYAVVWNHYVLLTLSAVLNVSLWLWIVSTCLLGIVGSVFVDWQLSACDQTERRTTNDKLALLNASNNSHVYGSTQTEGNLQGSDSVIHLIVLPNYKEEEAMLAETLESLSQAKDARSFHVVLAMEAREAGSADKAKRLEAAWAKSFAQLWHFCHPADLTQEHNDGSKSPEVAGKASNVKWAVRQAYDRLKEDEVVLSNVVLTVADADCIFHPDYFCTLTKSFNQMRENPGAEQKWTMWQAPQLSYRDHWKAIICARSWTYVSSMYEFGGVSGLFFGGHHMVFSSYSLTLELAMAAQSWDGDIVAEDHHAYIKNFFFSAYESARMSLQDPSMYRGCRPMLQVKPVFLPVKSTPVISERGYWQNYIERWHQAKRHTQGVAEVSYALLAAWDALCVMPISLWSFSFFAGIGKVIIRLFCMHILPIIQSVGLGTLSLYWLWNGRQVPMCPDFLSFSDLSKSEYILCGLAGAWVLTWPVVIPMVLLIICNFCFVYVSFLKPSRVKGDDSLWRREDGNFPKFDVFCGSKAVAAFALIACDMLGTFVMMVPYGFLAMLVSAWNTAFYGNVFNYITAAKATKAADKLVDGV